MTFPVKICVIGAGSASFGENTLSAIMRSKRLRGSTLALVDLDAGKVDIVKRLADRLNREWDCQMEISAHTHHFEALAGSDFVVSAIEVVPREGLWKSDFEIPLKYGVRQPYAENGGPGGFAHAARNIGQLMPILRDMEKICPDAWFVNYTNPMIRMCEAINRHSRIKAVGLCHQIYVGYLMTGMMLREELGVQVPEGITWTGSDVLQAPLHGQVVKQTVPLIDIRAAGLNHFTWILSMHDRRTGEDLYPIFRKRWAAYDPEFEPLTRQLFEDFGLMPVSGDTHLCEYLPWLSDPQTKPWEKYNIRLYDWDLFTNVREITLDRLQKIAEGEITVDGLLETDSEGALEMIENVAAAGKHYHLAANLPNAGQIANLPLGTAVETPVMVDGSGIHPVHVGALPGPIAELCRHEIEVARLCVDAAVEGDRQKALQCLLLDPMVNDRDVARRILDDYLQTYRQYLPQFWV